MINKTFTATIQKGTEKTSWTCIVWKDSVAFFGTGKAVKVVGTIDGYDFQATFLPLGDGTHMLPLRAAIMNEINKQPGDTVEIHLHEKS